MEGISKDSLRADWPLALVLAALWACLHTSPYYPFTASPGFASADTGALAAHHVWYSATFVLSLAVLLLGRWKVPQLVRPRRSYAVAAGVLGVAGGALLATGAFAGGAGELASCALVAVSTAFFAVELLVRASALGRRRGSCLVAFSYCIFSAVWLVAGLAGNGFSIAVPVVCPLVCTACLLFLPDIPAPDDAGTGAMGAAYRTLPWPVLGLSCAFVFFSAVSVRLFTAMEQGVARAGALSGAYYAITAAAGLALAVALLLLAARRGMGAGGLEVAFSLFTLIFMGVLLLVMAAPGSQAALAARRVMVAVEHAFDLMLAVVLVSRVARNRLDPYAVFAMFGIVVLALPQLVSLDVMYFTGALDSASGFNLVLPIAGVAAFFVAASVVLLLMRSNRQAAQQAALSADDWQRALCASAVEGLDITGREFDVLVLTYRGLSAKKAAEELYVSESTVKTHLQHIYRKMNVHSKQELIARVNSLRES